MASINLLTPASLAALLGVMAMQIPSILVVLFTHRNFAILATRRYWTVAGASTLPSLIGLLLFLAGYPLLDAPNEAALAGLWFIVVGVVMVAVGSARHAHRYPRIEASAFRDAFGFGAWPYALALVLFAILRISGHRR